MTYIEAMQLVAARSPRTGSEAAKTIRRLTNNTVTAQRIAERVIEHALQDHQAEFTADERLALASLLSGDTGEARTLDIRVRVTADEKQRVHEAAQAAGMTLSDYLRQQVGL